MRNLDLDHRQEFWWQEKNAHCTPTFVLKNGESDGIAWSAAGRGWAQRAKFMCVSVYAHYYDSLK